MKTSSVWMYSILPIAAVSGGLGVLLPLYILSLGGSVYDVGIATALYALISIPASIFWGDLTDRLNRIKLFVLISVIGLFPVLLILYFLTQVAAVESVYGLYAFIATASAPALNIMVMSSRMRKSLPKYFSRYSTMLIIGDALGMVPGLFIDGSFAKDYLLLLLVVNVISLVLAFRLISADKTNIEPKHKKTVKKSFGVLNMLSVTPYVLTGHFLIDRIRKGLKRKVIRHIYLLLASISLFNLALYLFNTSYIPFLYAHSLTYSQIFIVNMGNAIAQLIVYVVVLSLLSNINLERYYKVSTLLRSAAPALAFLPLAVMPGFVFGWNILAYFVAGIAYAIWNITSSVMLYEKIRRQGPGHYVGVWAAVLGFSGVLGAFLSGLLSAMSGYVTTFLFSILALGAAFFVFSYKKG